MKKKILFFHFDLQGGGAEKVLTNLLNNLSPEKYDITLQTLFGVGPNLKAIPQYVHFKCLFKREFRGFSKFMKLFSPTFLHKLIVRDTYDIEIGYMENSPTRIISGCTRKETKKIAWVHTTFDDFDACTQSFRNFEEVLRSYKSFDKIVFVSEQAKKVFEKKMPQISTPKSVLHNVNNIKKIIELSKENCPISLNDNVVNICSVGRLIPVKGYDRLLRILKLLHDDPTVPVFNFYFLGKGAIESDLKELSKKLKLENVVSFLGYDENPYRYVSKMDLFVCSSYKEGYSTAVSEAIVLGVPVVTTECSGMKEILNDGQYGLIVQNSEQDLLNGLKKYLKEESLQNQYKTALNNRERQCFNLELNKYELLFDSI